MQELRIASRGGVDLVEGLETNQKNGEEREYLRKEQEAHASELFVASLMMFARRN